MSTEEFKTYWIVAGVRVKSYNSMKQMVEGGKTAIEVSATRQKSAAEKRTALASANAIEDEQIRRAASQREHEQSPEGQRQAAIRIALENPGGVVSGGENPFAELDEYLPHKTSLLR